MSDGPFCLLTGRSGSLYWLELSDPGDWILMERTCRRIYFAPVEDEI